MQFILFNHPWHHLTFAMVREDLQEFRSRAAASGLSRNPPTSQIAIKEKEDSLFVPGVSKQMGILSRLGIKVCSSRHCTHPSCFFSGSQTTNHPAAPLVSPLVNACTHPPPCRRRERAPIQLSMRLQLQNQCPQSTHPPMQIAASAVLLKLKMQLPRPVHLLPSIFPPLQNRLHRLRRQLQQHLHK